jgi:rhodanese-related sulfurtransferase
VSKLVPSSLVAVVVTLATSLSSSAALACGGDKTAQSSATVVASQTDKSAPAPKSDTAAPAAEQKKAEATFKIASVDDVQRGLDGLKKDKKPFAIFDANGKSTRESKGIIPTAVLLPSSSSYDLSLLPKDKATPTVFYCSNERCTASHTAAKRAIEAGYSDVAVLSAGIAGWVGAGKPTEKPPVG